MVYTPPTFTTWSDDPGGDEVVASIVNDIQASVTDLYTALGATTPAGTAASLLARLAKSLSAGGLLQMTAATTLTISGGVITVTGNYHRIDTESSAATDNLDTITAGTEAWLLFLRTNNSARDVTIKHATGNIKCTGDQDIILSTTNDLAVLIYDDDIDLWLAFSLTQAAMKAAANVFTAANSFQAAMILKYTAVSGDTTLDATHHIVAADATAGAVVITLPTAVGIAGTEYVVKKIDSSANTVTVDGATTETIDGASTKVLSAQWAYTRIISNGANWIITG
jgi:hypothetical protein